MKQYKVTPRCWNVLNPFWRDLGETMSKSSMSSSYPRKYDQIRYPEKSFSPKKHLYDLETHRKYAAAMSYLKSKKRRGNGVFVENKGMIYDLLLQGHQPSHVFYCKEDILEKIPQLPKPTKLIKITERQISRLTDVNTNQGIMAVFDQPNKTSCIKDAMPLIIYLDRLRDPGNVGTIIRSAAGAACTSVVSSPVTASFWLPATVRGSAAANYLIPLHEHMEFTAILDTLPADWNLCFVEVQGKSSSEPIRSIPYHEADFTSPTLMVFGREVGGLSSDLEEQAIKHGSHNIISTYIPTIPQLDSINVSMAATVLIYEMARQQKNLAKKDSSQVVEDLYSLYPDTPNLKDNDVVEELEIMFPPTSPDDTISNEEEDPLT